MNSQQLYKSLTKEASFKEWQKKHPDVYLSHLFCALKNDLSEKDNWEIGFFDPKNEKMTVFVSMGGQFMMRPEDGVFSKEKPNVEKLDLKRVKADFEKSSLIYATKAPALFAGQQLGDGFVILHNKESVICWTFTFISKTLQFCTLTVHAETSEILEHAVVNVVQRE